MLVAGHRRALARRGAAAAYEARARRAARSASRRRSARGVRRHAGDFQRGSLTLTSNGQVVDGNGTPVAWGPPPVRLRRRRRPGRRRPPPAARSCTGARPQRCPGRHCGTEPTPWPAPAAGRRPARPGARRGVHVVRPAPPADDDPVAVRTDLPVPPTPAAAPRPRRWPACRRAPPPGRRCSPTPGSARCAPFRGECSSDGDATRIEGTADTAGIRLDVTPDGVRLTLDDVGLAGTSDLATGRYDVAGDTSPLRRPAVQRPDDRARGPRGRLRRVMRRGRGATSRRGRSGALARVPDDLPRGTTSRAAAGHAEETRCRRS